MATRGGSQYGVARSLFELPKLITLVVVLVVVVGSHELERVMGAQYTVGDSVGWGLGNDLQSWSTQFKFQVGDELYFPYPSGQHSVLLVTEEDYKSCNIENPVSSDNGLGDMVISLADAETYYFICGVPGHCAQGLRLSISVEPGSTDHLPPPPAEEVITSHPPPAEEVITSHPPPDHAPAEDMAPPYAPPDTPHDVVTPVGSTDLSPPYYSKYNTFHRNSATPGAAIFAYSTAVQLLVAISSVLLML